MERMVKSHKPACRSYQCSVGNVPRIALFRACTLLDWTTLWLTAFRKLLLIDINLTTTQLHI